MASWHVTSIGKRLWERWGEVSRHQADCDKLHIGTAFSAVTKNVQGQTCEVQFFRNNVHTGKLWPINPTSPAGKNASGQLGLPPTAAPVIDMPGAQPDMSQNPNKATAQRQQTGQTGQAGRLNKKQSKLKLAFSEIKLRRQELNDNHSFFLCRLFFLKKIFPKTRPWRLQIPELQEMIEERPGTRQMWWIFDQKRSRNVGFVEVHGNFIEENRDWTNSQQLQIYGIYKIRCFIP